MAFRVPAAGGGPFAAAAAVAPAGITGGTFGGIVSGAVPRVDARVVGVALDSFVGVSFVGVARVGVALAAGSFPPAWPRVGGGPPIGCSA
ncbi:MAG: hypothetical protein Q8P41_31445, partial [Pseudomonadota bacterium]|nr:hypothetical protein [Pseudomonadota bacterium]